jgi:hypothetical protein
MAAAAPVAQKGQKAAVPPATPFDQRKEDSQDDIFRDFE